MLLTEVVPVNNTVSILPALENEEVPQPRHAGVDWYNPLEVKDYIKDVYGKFADLLIWIVNRESSFNPDAVNGNFVGFVQIGPEACKAVKMNYDSVAKFPHMNLEAGTRFLKWYCVPQAKKAVGKVDRAEIYRRYNLGPWYDDPKYLSRKEKNK